MSKNIKSIATSGLTYTGIVRLSLYTAGKKFLLKEQHNIGGRPLFDFLTDCLTGDFDIAKADIPNKILLLNKDPEDKLSKAANTSFITILAKPEKKYSSANESVVCYSFILPPHYFTGTSFNAIGLYTKTASELDINDYAALCDIDLSDISLSIASVVVLDWELHISN